MGLCEAVHAAFIKSWTASHDGYASGVECNPIHGGDGVSVGTRHCPRTNGGQGSLPKDFPPFTTVQYYFYRLRDSGLLDIINEALVIAVRLISGREACPTAGIIPLSE